MRTMKDKERLFIIIKVFLDIQGPSTAREISDYVNSCPIKLQMHISSGIISGLLKGGTVVDVIKGDDNTPNQYLVKA